MQRTKTKLGKVVQQTLFAKYQTLDFVPKSNIPVCLWRKHSVVHVPSRPHKPATNHTLWHHLASSLLYHTLRNWSHISAFLLTAMQCKKCVFRPRKKTQSTTTRRNKNGGNSMDSCNNPCTSYRTLPSLRNLTNNPAADINFHIRLDNGQVLPQVFLLCHVLPLIFHGIPKLGVYGPDQVQARLQSTQPRPHVE